MLPGRPFPGEPARRSFRDVLPIIRHHLERMDGTGYPDGLKGVPIPLTVRVLTTVDIYDALATDRPYRKALSQAEAFAELRKEVQRGWWDGSIVDELEVMLWDSEFPRDGRRQAMNTDGFSYPAVSQSHEPSWERLERLDWHLWMLAILLIFVLGVSLLSFMFPSTFWFGEELAVQRPQRAFFGFCVLLALVLVYLLQRQATIRQLKRQLFRSQAEAIEARREAAIRSFQTLPGTSQFRDTLAMEFRRASASNANLAVLLLMSSNATLEKLGYISNVLRALLRQGESLYRLSDTGIGIILPGLELNMAASFVVQAEGLLGLPKGELEVRMAAYPDHAGSLTELEQRLRERVSA